MVEYIYLLQEGCWSKNVTLADGRFLPFAKINVPWWLIADCPYHLQINISFLRHKADASTISQHWCVFYFPYLLPNLTHLPYAVCPLASSHVLLRKKSPSSYSVRPNMRFLRKSCLCCGGECISVCGLSLVLDPLPFLCRQRHIWEPASPPFSA